MREAFATKWVLPLEQVLELKTHQEIADTLTYWRIEAEERRSQQGGAPGQAEATERGYQLARQRKRAREAGQHDA